MVDIVLCVLCGIPGCGKTTLCRRLVSSGEKFTYVHVAFDELTGWIENQSDGAWKQSRSMILSLVGNIVEFLRNDGGELPSRSQFNALDENEVGRLLQAVQTVASRNDKSATVVLLIDDNMYYKSMRYSYHQLAEQFTLGYCIVYLSCSYDTCSDRLRHRADGHLIKESSVKTIVEQLEKPDPVREKWEHFSKEFDSGGNESSPLILYEQFIETCVDHPVETNKLSEREIEERDLTRKVNAANLLHQADLCLRKIVGDMSKEIISDAKNKSTQMKKIVQERKRLIAAMKSDGFDFNPFLDEYGDIQKESLTLELRKRVFNEI